MLSIRYGLHPYLPERLGYRRLLRLANARLSQLLSATDAFTLVTARRRVTLYREAQRALERNVAGDFVEIGVHRGGTAALLAFLLHAAPERRLHLFDRWGDLPEPTEEDGHRKDEYARDRIPEKLKALQDRPPLQDVKHLLHTVLGFPEGRTFYHQGWYQQTLDPATTAYGGAPIAFASLDCDFYLSMCSALSFVDRFLAPRGTIVLDDYTSWPGVKRAVDEFLAVSRRPWRLRVLLTDQAILHEVSRG